METVWDLLRLSPGLFRTSMDFLYSKHCQTMFFGIMWTILGAAIPWQNGKYRAWNLGSWAESGWLNAALVKGKSIEKQPLAFSELFVEILEMFILCFSVFDKSLQLKDSAWNYSSLSIPICSESKYSRSSEDIRKLPPPNGHPVIWFCLNVVGTWFTTLLWVRM